jgi:hypothetical protein
VVDVAAIYSAIEAALTAARPDGRYALEGTGFQPTILVSPDKGQQFAPRDLLVLPKLRGPAIDGQKVTFPLSVLLITANYSGDRTSLSSGVPISAEERAHGFALHVLDVLEELPLPGGAIAAIGYDDPRVSAPPDWMETLCTLTVIVAR